MSNHTQVNQDLQNVFDWVHPKMKTVFLPWILQHPRYLKNAFSLIHSFQKAEKIRKTMEAKGTIVPPILIVSITSQCNLFCSGCFASATGTLQSGEESHRGLGYAEWKKIIAESESLGVFCFLIAGGEPLLFPDLLKICKENSHLLFVLFTNGTIMNEELLQQLKRVNNTVVVVSVEGDERLTDLRRGTGTFAKAMKTLQSLEEIKVLNGISVTINKINFPFWANEKNMDAFIQKGIKICFFTELIPVEEEGIPNPKNGMEFAMMLSEEERLRFREQVLYYRNQKDVFLIHSPGDEEKFGGCVSAGRGFVHVTPFGDVTACPVSNIATHNLLNSTLEEALNSELFQRIRKEEGLLKTGSGPCALFSHQLEMEAVRQQVGGYRTGV